MQITALLLGKWRIVIDHGNATCLLIFTKALNSAYFINLFNKTVRRFFQLRFLSSFIDPLGPSEIVLFPNAILAVGLTVAELKCNTEKRCTNRLKASLGKLLIFIA